MSANESIILAGVMAGLWIVREVYGFVRKVQDDTRKGFTSSREIATPSDANASGGYPAVTLPNEELATRREVSDLRSWIRRLEERDDRLAKEVQQLTSTTAALEATLRPLSAYFDRLRDRNG